MAPRSMAAQPPWAATTRAPAGPTEQARRKDKVRTGLRIVVDYTCKRSAAKRRYCCLTFVLPLRICSVLDDSSGEASWTEQFQPALPSLTSRGHGRAARPSRGGAGAVRKRRLPVVRAQRP